jgi:hypothetical protein
MRKLFAPNIATAGRIARAIWGLCLIVAAVLIYSRSHVVCFILAAAGVFALFEALRGWCVMRACGIKTRM